MSSFVILGVSTLIYINRFLTKLAVSINVDPDQTPHNAASDLVLHCLPKSILWDTRHEWLKVGCCAYDY